MILLGVDLGDRRIGFATCDEEWIIASPLRYERVRGPADAVPVIAALVAETGAARVILGHPIDMSGRRGPKAKEAQEIARILQEEKGIPVTLWDERLTTAEAERSLKQANLNRKERKAVIDAVAAQRILHSFMEGHKKEDIT